MFKNVVIIFVAIETAKSLLPKSALQNNSRADFRIDQNEILEFIRRHETQLVLAIIPTNHDRPKNLQYLRNKEKEMRNWKKSLIKKSLTGSKRRNKEPGHDLAPIALDFSGKTPMPAKIVVSLFEITEKRRRLS